MACIKLKATQFNGVYCIAALYTVRREHCIESIWLTSWVMSRKILHNEKRLKAMSKQLWIGVIKQITKLFQLNDMEED